MKDTPRKEIWWMISEEIKKIFLLEEEDKIVHRENEEKVFLQINKRKREHLNEFNAKKKEKWHCEKASLGIG